MSDHDTFIVIVGIVIIGSIIYSLWLANYHRKQLIEQLELKDRESAIYQNIITQWEQRLVKKTRKISPKWIKQWDEEVRHWEKDLLEIKNPRIGHLLKSSGQWPLMVKDICMQGCGEARFLYEKALKAELTSKHYERINVLMTIQTFRGLYLKAMRLMRKNRVILQKFVDPLTKKKRYKHTMLSLHWCLYVVDDMIIALYEQQQEEKTTEVYKELAQREIYWDDISKYTEYEEIEKILKFPYHLYPNYELLLSLKRALLSLLYDISDTYKAARNTFIYYKRLIDTVKKGYMAFDKDCRYSTVRNDIDACRKKDKERKKGLRIAKETPTFEKAYKLGVIEWMKVSNKKCDNQCIFWKMLVEINNSKEKLQIIFGGEKVKALEEAIDKNKKQFENEIQEAVLANNYLKYNKSYAYLINTLE